MRKSLLLLMFLACSYSQLQAQSVSTFAGTPGLSGTTNGTGNAARFNSPHALATDKAGNVFVADRLNNVIRKITPSGVVSVLAGSGLAGAVDATGTAASFFEPYGIACDTAGNVYVADTKNFKIRKITPAGVVSTIAGQGVFGTTNGPGTNARFGYPVGIAVTPDGNTIYVSDYNTHVIREIVNGNVSTIAGMIYVTGTTNGTGSAATFNHPAGLFLTSSGNLLIADEWNNQIRQMTPLGSVTTYAGTGMPGSADGSAMSATFNSPACISNGPAGKYYITDAVNNTIRSIDPATQTVATYAGAAGQSGSIDGPIASARFNTPYGIAYYPSGVSIFCSDQANHTIRKIVSLSAIQLSIVAATSTTCAGDSITFTIAPSGLSSYTVIADGNVIATSNNPVIKTGPLSSGVHSITCTAIDGTGALASGGPITITVDPPFVPAITAPVTSVCPNDSVLLTAQTGSNYLWSTGATGNSIYVTSAGNYSVTLTNSSGCRGTSSTVTISQLTVSPVSISPTGIKVCPGSTATLTASAGNAYLWSNGATTQSITSTSGTYTVSVTQSNGCKANKSATIATYTVSAPSLIPSGTQQLFPGDSILISASGGATYNWSSGQTSASIYVNTPGTYTVSAIDTNGCNTPSVSIQIIPFNTSTMFQVVGVNPFCETDSTYLQSAFLSNNQWFLNGQPVSGATTPVHYPDQTGYYKLQVVIGSTPVMSDSILITVNPTPADPQVSNQIICSGTSAILNAITGSNESVRWYDANSQLIYNGNPYTTTAVNQLTEYYAESVSAAGCISGSQVLVTVDVIPSPVADFSYNVSYTGGNWEVQYTDQSSGASSLYWLLGDTSTSSDINPLHTYQQSGDYTVIQIATASNGCVDSSIKNVALYSNAKHFLPTTFTPNADGKNDIFRVRGDRVMVEDMRIYSQWGSMIWEGKGQGAQWDGMSGGNIVPNGTYYYRIRIIDQGGKEQELTGSVTVIK